MDNSKPKTFMFGPCPLSNIDSESRYTVIHVSHVMSHMSRFMCHMSGVACHLLLTPTATATDPPPANSVPCTLYSVQCTGGTKWKSKFKNRFINLLQALRYRFGHGWSSLNLSTKLEDEKYIYVPSSYIHRAGTVASLELDKFSELGWLLYTGRAPNRAMCKCTACSAKCTKGWGI